MRTSLFALSSVLLVISGCEITVVKDTGSEVTPADEPRESGETTPSDTGEDTGGEAGADGDLTTPDCAHVVPPLDCASNTDACYETAAGSDNDDFDVATPLSAGDTIYAISCESSPTPSEDWDIYAVWADVGCVLEATATFDTSDGDIDFYLYSDSWTDRAHSTGIGDGESVRWISRSYEPHLLGLVNTNDTDANYALTTTVTCPPLDCVAGDPYEPNQDAIQALDDVDVYDVIKAQLCSGDEDWYSHPGQVEYMGCVMRATVEFDAAADGSIDVETHLSDVNSWDGVVDRSTPGRVVASFDSLTGGSGLFRVYNPNPAEGHTPEYTIAFDCEG